MWASVSSAVVEGPHGGPRFAITQVVDISAHRAETDRLAALALVDPLTGMANRLLFNDRLNLAARRSARHGRTLAVIYCDLDGFKAVNDQFGHDTGDDLLRQVGQRLKNAARPSDTVARLGGDEFALVCEDLLDEKSATLIADRVRATVEDPYLVTQGAINIGVSIGIATASGPGIEPRELTSRADLRMFTDKRARHPSLHGSYLRQGERPRDSGDADPARVGSSRPARPDPHHVEP